MKPKMTGRPRKDDGGALYESDIYQLLVRKLPLNYVNHGRLDVEAISTATGNAKFTIYRWLKEGNLSKKGARALIELSNSVNDDDREKLTVEDIIPFVVGI